MHRAVSRTDLNQYLAGGAATDHLTHLNRGGFDMVRLVLLVHGQDSRSARGDAVSWLEQRREVVTGAP